MCYYSCCSLQLSSSCLVLPGSGSIAASCRRAGWRWSCLASFGHSGCCWLASFRCRGWKRFNQAGFLLHQQLPSRNYDWSTHLGKSYFNTMTNQPQLEDLQHQLHHMIHYRPEHQAFDYDCRLAWHRPSISCLIHYYWKLGYSFFSEPSVACYYSIVNLLFETLRLHGLGLIKSGCLEMSVIPMIG